MTLSVQRHKPRRARNSCPISETDLHRSRISRLVLDVNAKLIAEVEDDANPKQPSSPSKLEF